MSEEGGWRGLNPESIINRVDVSERVTAQNEQPFAQTDISFTRSAAEVKS